MRYDIIFICTAARMDLLNLLYNDVCTFPVYVLLGYFGMCLVCVPWNSVCPVSLSVFALPFQVKVECIGSTLAREGGGQIVLGLGTIFCIPVNEGMLRPYFLSPVNEGMLPYFLSLLAAWAYPTGGPRGVEAALLVKGCETWEWHSDVD